MKRERYYQWLPNTGYDNQVVKLTNIYEEDGAIYYEFSNGEICNETFIAPFTKNIIDLNGKMLVELSSKNDIWTQNVISSKTVASNKDIQSSDGLSYSEIPPLEDLAQIEAGAQSGNVKSKVGSIRLIPPKTKVDKVPNIDYKDYMNDEDLIKLGLIEEKTIIKEEITEDEVEVSTIKEEEEKTNINNVIVVTDPIAILVNASAKNKINVPMELSIDLPSVDLFKIASTNFENGAEKFIDVILSHINYDMIKDSLKNALLLSYTDNDKE